MRGRKIDLEFVSKYIVNCVNNGTTNSDDIRHLALSEINDIDKKIKEVEDLKKMRSKLFDVTITLNRFEEKTSPIDFFDIKNKKISFDIINNFSGSELSLSYLLNNISESKDEILFSIKQLISSNVILSWKKNNETYFNCSINFNLFKNFLIENYPMVLY